MFTSSAWIKSLNYATDRIAASKTKHLGVASIHTAWALEALIVRITRVHKALVSQSTEHCRAHSLCGSLTPLYHSVARDRTNAEFKSPYQKARALGQFEFRPIAFTDFERLDFFYVASDVLLISLSDLDCIIRVFLCCAKDCSYTYCKRGWYVFFQPMFLFYWSHVLEKVGPVCCENIRIVNKF